VKSREPQYADHFRFLESVGPTSLGANVNFTWFLDPKRLTFTLSRYKFVSKMLQGMERVAELGCGDAFASRIVAQSVGHLTATDFDPLFISDAKKNLPTHEERISLEVHDILEGPIRGKPFDAIFSCDVLEHIAPENENLFFANAVRSLKPTGTFIVGTPSLASQIYASERSKEGHVNCKSGNDLLETCKTFFSSVFLFGMNDEVLHTGFLDMCHYYFALCLNPITDSQIRV
jgi:2-polyprenyl-3-methyl-5-hydroxy-6-metoxy-1,4-benzoquinol methylase